mmetsp:Transcript_145061/g.464861  ORF Transcript_145061/g.464861 Transcript_145061/m.464861 type:complete len:274 (-) Transcript_145061:177-998(-)
MARFSKELVNIYFGAGCFWHVQHEFIKAEQNFLKREGEELTAITGYAGGSKLNSKGIACYNDYTGLGHTEVVEVVIPRSAVSDFAAVFWKLFVGKDRVDTMDRGPAYRAALGLPGGISSPLFALIKAAQEGNVAQPFTMTAGAGDDPDTLGQALVWVYDTTAFPFHQAELYHQFHDDFLPGGDYPNSYNVDIRQQVLAACVRAKATGCMSDEGAPCAPDNDLRSLGGSGMGAMDGGVTTTAVKASNAASLATRTSFPFASCILSWCLIAKWAF